MEIYIPTLKQNSTAKRALIASATIGYAVISFVKLGLLKLPWKLLELFQNLAHFIWNPDGYIYIDGYWFKYLIGRVNKKAHAQMVIH